MRVTIFMICLSLFACKGKAAKDASSSVEQYTREAPEGFKKFTAFNNGYFVFYPSEWELSEKSKHETLAIVGPRPQSNSDIRPSVNVGMRRGITRFKDGESTYLPFKFEKFVEDYLETVPKQLEGFVLIDKSDLKINGIDAVSLKFNYSHPKSSEHVYQEAVYYKLPYRMYTLYMSCLEDERFRSEEFFEAIRESFTTRNRNIKNF